MTIIKRRMFRNDFPKGYYRVVVNSRPWPHVYTATMTCPNCGTLMSLENHSISADGTVSPSVVEPLNPKTKCPSSCGFHDFVKLEMWDMGLPPAADAAKPSPSKP